MKKYIITLIISLFLISIPNIKAINKPDVTDHEKVTIYLFWASWCPHCHDFIKYFNNIINEYKDYFEVVTYLVSKNDGEDENNKILLEKVDNKMEIGRVAYPTIIIGSNYYTLGFGSDGTKIIEAALDAYKDDNYFDLVSNIEKENHINSKQTSFNEACNIIGIESKAKEEAPNLRSVIDDFHKIIVFLLKKFYFIISNLL